MNDNGLIDPYAPGDPMDYPAAMARLQDENARLRAAIAKFQRDRGRHDGQHDFTESGIPCRHCEKAYIDAEAELDAALAEPSNEPHNTP